MSNDALSPSAFGLMFHHFYDGGRHPRGQGAISAETFNAMLAHFGEDLLDAREWADRLLTGNLRERQICITFDDGLRCQFDVARPVLEARGLTAFWFPYTGPLAGMRDRLEMYRYYRTVGFADIEGFYEAFERAWRAHPDAGAVMDGLAEFDPGKYLAGYPFYTDGDRRFRFIRDRLLGQERFFEVMDGMIADDGFVPDDVARLLWMGWPELAELQASGHVIGLHSHTHPTSLLDLDRDARAWEFDTNANMLEKGLGTTADCVAYPCGAYDNALISMLSERGVRVGFQSRMGPSDGAMTVPRLDHAIALQEMAATVTAKVD